MSINFVDAVFLVVPLVAAVFYDLPLGAFYGHVVTSIVLFPEIHLSGHAFLLLCSSSSFLCTPPQISSWVDVSNAHVSLFSMISQSLPLGGKYSG